MSGAAGSPKISLTAATALAEKLIRELQLDDALIAGSVRRGVAMVGDIDLVCSMPAPGARDRVCGAIEAAFARPVGSGMLFTPSEGMGVIKTGVKPGFKYCTLELHARLTGVFTKGLEMEVPVQIHRAVMGPHGNRGWIELKCTGPTDFGMAFLHAWKQRMKCPGEASVEGYLRDCNNTAVATPTEAECFSMCALAWVEPRMRVGGESVRRAG